MSQYNNINLLSRLVIAKHEDNPFASTTGIIGHGESFKINNKIYFYNYIGKFAPKDKPFIVKNESYFCGRRHGDINQYIVIFVESLHEFVVLCGVFQAQKDLKTVSKYTNIELYNKLLLNIERINSIDVSQYKF